MDFKNNAWFYVATGVLVLIILAQAIIFLIVAYKRGLKIGMDKKKLNKTITGSLIFSVVPSLSIILVIITLAESLGVPLPWARLTVVGAITYEIPAAASAAAAMGLTLKAAASTPQGFATIAWVMTLGIIVGPLIGIFFIKPLEKGMGKVKAKDATWSKILQDSLFLGMIAAFLGFAISGVTTNRESGTSIPATTGSILVSVLTLISSMLIMIVFAYFVKKKNIKWLENFALPLSMIGAMGLAILFRTILPAAMFI